jgi:hypothetical protein
MFPHLDHAGRGPPFATSEPRMLSKKAVGEQLRGLLRAF